ncbi:E3 ubiquitin ligase PARAQUAT TOLERANCE 3-like isoform X2 [Macadamia integrifolia]|uniref:E3 ubiquitin ligase PARAQUAT TOLERANCE 3-like isoform X2 n=1 Tax=Macadamia integrifolia TaxID=60698 RepID=UPI001C4F1B65|nr:E3 ubiquitin ligase PARAQUAT TOLERANCE 3-like isoform X2 [Macadamia integrifolia]
MAGVVYYKFKSSRDYSSIPMFGNFISVANLKTEIFQSNRLRRNTALILSNANSNEEYLDEDMLIPKHTSVIVRRVPGRPTLPIVVEKHKKKFIEDKGEATQANSSFDAAQSVLTTASTHLSLSPEKFIEDKVEALQANSGFDEAQSSVMKFPEELDLDDFGDDVYADPKVLPVWSSNPVVDAPCPSETDEDSRIMALVNTPALNWQGPSQKGLCSGRDYGRGKGRRMMGAQGCGNSPSNPVVDAPCPSETDEDSRIKALVNTPALNWQRPSQKGLCSGRDYGRSKGRRMMGALGYGRAGLDAMTPPQGYVCHRCNISGHFIQHCPTNDDPNYDFKRVKSTVCPVAVLNEAAFEKEFEGLPSTKSVTNFPPELHCPMCKEVMKDAMLTRKCCFMSFCDRCIRNHIISNSMCFCGATNVLVDDLVPNVTLRETIISILENSGSMKNQGTDSACHEQSKLLSSTISFASSEDKISSPNKDGTLYIKERTDEEKDITNAPQSSLEDGTGAPVTLNKNDVLEERASNDPDGYNQGSIPRDLVPGDCMMPLCSSAYNPHGDNMPLGMDGYMACYFGVPSHWGYAAPYFNVPVGGPMSQESFVGHWDSLSHQRDLSERAWMSNPIVKISEPRRKHKIKQHGES